MISEGLIKGWETSSPAEANSGGLSAVFAALRYYFTQLAHDYKSVQLEIFFLVGFVYLGHVCMQFGDGLKRRIFNSNKYILMGHTVECDFLYIIYIRRS